MSLCWLFSREDLEQKTPSREDGIPLSLETRYRKEGARFIINASTTLGLRFDTHATGVVFFHRFFMLQSFKQFSRWVVAAACLLLAGKVEETPKKCKDVLKVTRSLLTEQQMSAFGSNPKEELLTHERILLQTIKFDLQVLHPYGFLLKFAKGLKGEKAKIERLVQMAWTFVNDSLCTTLCLQWEPQAIAVAFLYLAGKLSKQELVAVAQQSRRSWWRAFVDTLDMHDLEAICHQVLDFYGEKERQKAADENQEQAPSTSSKATPTHIPSPSQTSGPPSTGVSPHPLAVSTPSHPHTHPQPLLTPSQPNLVPLPPAQPHPQPPTTLPTNQSILQAVTMAAIPSAYPLHTPTPAHSLPPSLITPSQPIAYSALGILAPHSQVPRPLTQTYSTTLGTTSLTAAIASALPPSHPHTSTLTPSLYPMGYQPPHPHTPTPPLLPQAQPLLGTATPTKQVALDPAYQPHPHATPTPPYGTLHPSYPPTSTPSLIPQAQLSLTGAWPRH